MHNFTEQFITALAWFAAFGLGIFTIWLFATAFERVHLRARRRAFKKPAPGKNPAHEFLRDWCDRTSGARIYASDLFDAYRLWCKDNEVKPSSRNTFGKSMTKMKVERETGRWVQYLDLELNPKGRRRIAIEEKANR